LRRSIGLPLGLGIALIALVLGLAVGWPLLVVNEARTVARGLSRLDWLLLVLGILGFALVSLGLAWLCLWLVREMRLNQSQRAFLDAVTHEMKTPLASLRLYLDTLRLHQPGREQQREFLARMEQDVERLHRTVDQVLTAARAEEPGKRRTLRAVDLPELLRQCTAEVLAHHHLPERAIAIHTQPDAAVRADPTELAVVFRNLLENAVKYSEDPVEVSVRVASGPEGRVEVEISDRGIGIPAGELRKIFQRFYRVGRDVQRTASGLGLGLFIVRSLVRRQGGRVVARSAGSGAGSRFVVSLRAAARELSG
jgi:signal transduction histidine kinase